MAEGFARKLVCFLYINPSPESLDEDVAQKPIPRAVLESVVQSLDPTEPWQITETGCGFIAAFSSESDAERLLHVDLAVALEGPVQIARFSSCDARYRHAVLLRDVPSAIPLQDISEALCKQDIAVGSVERVKQHVRVEVLDASQYQSLLFQGLDFFGATRFTAMPEKWWRGGNNYGTSGNIGMNCENQRENDQNYILQCYRCQGFWHVAANCRHLPRCVRCGEPHNVEFCPRPRHDPVCCHCAGPHHAGYKRCPVRLQLLNATPVNITLSSARVPRSKQLWTGSL
ncbi:uncharacterized protein [Periplaneta americana]|uniref:uncharacterized protein n=1 Tax=Periplaneta americana TaxID=6978 RepID=UPI0037E87A84